MAIGGLVIKSEFKLVKNIICNIISHMKGQELKIIFKDDLAFLTEEVALDFKQVKLPDPTAKFKAPAFWIIRVINYIENEKKLYVEVLSYQVGETAFSKVQIELADILMLIEDVTFRSIDTSGLLRTLKSETPIRISAPIPQTGYRQETPTEPENKIEREPVKVIYNEPFSIPIKNITFLSGKVSFEKKIQQFKQPILFEILNEDVIEEYDAIKNYFASVLKTKKIQVIPTIITEDGVITSIKAMSSEIEKIDKTLIKEVKFEFINGVRRKESLGDKQLFTMEEYIETFAGKEFKVKQFFKDDNEFFENLLEKSETKHYKHLRFLSSKQKYDLQKLRFVHKPFSFVFLLTGITKFHIVWETLDTQEATYIWTFANDVAGLKKYFANTEKTINLIVKNGKNEYISRNEENFNRVFHDYMDLQNGFRKWKAEIEEVILL
jgi:hypothetical protein